MAGRTNEESLDLFADLMEPVANIIADEEIRESVNKGEPRVRTASKAIKNHKAEVIQILALLEGVPVEEYHVNLLALPVKLVRLLSTPEVQELFTGAEQKTDAASSGSATENTKDGAI